MWTGCRPCETMTCYVPQTSEAKRSDTFIFWERSGPHPKGGFTSRGAKRRVRFEKRNHAPAGCTHMHACAQCTRSTIIYAPGGCMKFTHTAGVHAHTCTRSVTTEAKRGHATHPKGARKKVTARSHLHVHVIVSKLRTHARAHAHTRTEGAVYEPRSEAESALRKRKTNRAMRMHLRCIRTIHAPFGCMYPHPKGAV